MRYYFGKDWINWPPGIYTPVKWTVGNLEYVGNMLEGLKVVVTGATVPCWLSDELFMQPVESAYTNNSDTFNFSVWTREKFKD